jgi:hypothetical protein
LNRRFRHIINDVKKEMFLDFDFIIQAWNGTVPETNQSLISIEADTFEFLW